MGQDREEWYVVRVESRRERVACSEIEEAARALELREGRGEQILSELFWPRFATQRKSGGEWRRVERPLIPGYVIAATSEPSALARALRLAASPMRVLTFGGAYVPLLAEERAWIESYTGRGERVVPMSVAYKEGDTLVVASGPLKGREATIVRTVRSKNLAHIELHVGGLRIKTVVGLGVLPKEKALSLSA